MGTLIGHLIPGVMFLLISIWWFIGELLQNRHGSYFRRGLPSPESRHKTSLRVWYLCPCARLSKIPLEPITKLVCAVFGVIAEMVITPSRALLDKDGEFVFEHLNNYGHTAMYSFFGLSGAVDLLMFYNLLPLPPKFDYLTFSTAFWIEGFLFAFHLHGRSDLDVRLHTILYLIIFITAALFLVEAMSARRGQFFAFFRAYLLSLQGTWFLQIGYVLYGSNPWKSDRSNVSFTAIAFAFHAFILFVIYLICHTVCFHICIKKYQLNNGISEANLDEDVNSVMLQEFADD